MEKKLAPILIFALAALSVGAGCGGGGADPLPKQAFLKQANAICLHGAKERESTMSTLTKEAGGEPQASALVDEGAVPAMNEMVEELDGLGVPEGDEKQVEAILTGLEEGIETIEADPEKGLGSAAFEKSNKAATAYGLPECVI